MSSAALKPDLDRMGIFKEMSYHTIGDPYVDQLSVLSTNFKGRQMTVSHSKSRSALPDGYFSEYKRIFAGDSKFDMATVMRRQRKASKKLVRGKDWIPVSSVKPISSSGSYYDTFSGPIPYIKPNSTSTLVKNTYRKNILTSPGKKGSGSYVNVTLNPYPPHLPDPYDRAEQQQAREIAKLSSLSKGKKPFYTRLRASEYFEENPFRTVKPAPRRHLAPAKKLRSIGPPFKPSSPGKKDGGCKMGCLNPFPVYQSSPEQKKRGTVTRKPALHFAGCSLPYPVSSIVDLNIKKAVNASNYKRVKSIVYSLSS